MDFAQSFNNQSSSLWRINVMVVDDDPVFLHIMSRMLEKSVHRDPSVTEITVIAAKGSMEALATLKVERNNVDLIVTDYYMPGMNGLQLKAEITREFGNLPVIVMSSDKKREEESLTCGAMCFIAKPIKGNDLTKIYQYAITYKRNGKSIILTDQHINNNVKVTDVVTLPRQIELLPEQANDLNVNKKKKGFSGTDCVSTNGLPKNRKRRSGDGSCDDGDDESDLLMRCKKNKVTWTDDLHDLFLQAIRHIGLDKAVPKKILQYMNVTYLTRENVASHLQKYRLFLRRVAERGMMFSKLLSESGIDDSSYPYAQIISEPYQDYYTSSASWYDTTFNKSSSSSYSKPRQGLGQSRLLSNPRDDTTTVRSNQVAPYNYMSRSSSTYEPNLINGSNLTLPMIKSCLINFSNQSPSKDKGKASLFEPPVMKSNEIGQTSQVRGFGQHGPPAAVDGNNSFSNIVMSNYGSLTPNEKGLNNSGSLTPNQTGFSSYSSLTPNQTGVSSFGNQTGLNSNESSAPKPQGLNSYESLTPNQTGLSSYGNQTGPNNYESSTPKQGPNQTRLDNYGNPTGLRNYGSSTPKQGLSSYESLTPNQTGLDNYGNQTGLSSYGSSTPKQGLNSFESLTPNQTGFGSYGSLTPNQTGFGSYGSSTPKQGLNSYGSLTPNQTGLSSYGNQTGLSSYGSSTPKQGLSSYESLNPNQTGFGSYGSLTPNKTGFGSYGSLTLNRTGLSNYGSLTPDQTGLRSYENQTGLSSYGRSTPKQQGLNNYGSLTPNQTGFSSFGNQTGLSSSEDLTPNQTGRGSYGSLTPIQTGPSNYENQAGLSSYASLIPNQTRLGSYGSLTPNQTGLSSNYGSLTPNQTGLSSSHEKLTTNQPGLNNYGSLTPYQPGSASFGNITPNQSGSSRFGSLTPFQPELSSYGSLTPIEPAGLSQFSFDGSLTPIEPGLSHFSFDGSLTPTEPGLSQFSFEMLSFLNDENDVPYETPQTDADATTVLPNLEYPELEKLSLYDDLEDINELSCVVSNFQFGNNKQQEDVTSTKFDLPDLPSELNQFFSLDDDDDDWTFLNVNQGDVNGDTLNTIAAPEMNAPTFDMNPNQNQEQDDVPDWSFLDMQELVDDDDFMNSLFASDMD